MVGQQRQQISELQFDTFSKPQSFLVWKIRFKNQVSTCSDFPLVDSLDKKIPRDQLLERIFQILRCWTRRLLLLWTRSIIQNSQFKKKVCLEEQKAKKEDRFLRGRQIAFMIDDYFRVTGAHGTVLDYADLFSVTLHDDNVQEFDSRWDEVLLSISRIPSDDLLESLYNLRIHESAQLKTVLELYDLEIHQQISMPNYQTLKNDGCRGEKIRNFDHETLTPDTGEVKQEQWSRIERDWVALKEEKVPVTSGKSKASVRKETHVVSPAWDSRSCAKTRTQSRHTFWAIRATRSKCVEEKNYLRQKKPRCHSSTTVQILFERSLHAIALWMLGFFPSVNSTKQKWVAKPGFSVAVSLSMSSRRGRPHGHRYGRKPGDTEYYLANQLKRKCKKRQFQGIRDRFLQDQEFRIRMIEHHRDEEVCRRWDALADEDHTHHLTVQEYLHYKNKWWLHSKKQGSNTMPLRHRSDFKQAVSTLQRLQQEAGEEPHVPTYA